MLSSAAAWIKTTLESAELAKKFWGQNNRFENILPVGPDLTFYPDRKKIQKEKKIGHFSSRIFFLRKAHFWKMQAVKIFLENIFKLRKKIRWSPAW